MIVFRNRGLIDLLAVTTMGVSVKEPGSFGYFGTGLKYALATILRDGGEVFLFRGPKAHKITTGPSEIRGETFNIVKLDGRRLGFTDQLGKNWEPWMVLRELGCNATDEGGGFEQVGDDQDVVATASDDETIFAVRWGPLEEAWEGRDDIFFGARTPLLSTPDLVVAEGPSDHAFYRGVRALKLEHPSAFTYNVLAEQRLTEDRQISGEYYVRAVVRRTWLQCADSKLLERVLTTGSDNYEYQVDYDNDYETTEPSKTFIDVCYDLAGKRRDELNPRALALFQKHIRKASTAGGYTSSHRMQDAFGLALEALGEMFDKVVPDPDGGFLTDPLGIEKAKFVLVEELPDDALSMVEDRRIYVNRSLLKQPKRTIASELLVSLLKAGYLDPTRILVPVALQSHGYTRLSPKERFPDADLEPQQLEEGDGTPAACVPAIEAPVAPELDF